MASETDPLHRRKGRDMEGKMNASEIFRVALRNKVKIFREFLCFVTCYQEDKYRFFLNEPLISRSNDINI